MSSVQFNCKIIVANFVNINEILHFLCSDLKGGKMRVDKKAGLKFGFITKTKGVKWKLALPRRKN